MRQPTATTPSRDERITAAALDLLRRKGPRDVTIEAVAAASGVAKTTIYRRYRDRDEMLTAALSSTTTPERPTDTSDLLPILEWVADRSRATIDDGIGVGGIAAVLTDADPAFTALIRSLLAEHRRNLAEVLAGTPGLREDLDVDAVLDTIVGAYLAERTRSGAVGPQWSRRILRTVWPMLTTAPMPVEIQGRKSG
ncbi:MAG TPA: TetR/AcrR family transcriptional regulator [Aldersonia sp.]